MSKRSIILHILFSASLFALVLKVMVPGRTYLVVTEPTVRIIEVSGLYTLTDVLIIVFLSLASGFLGAAILWGEMREAGAGPGFVSPRSLADLLREMDNLGETERAVLREIVANGGSIQQSELQRKLDLPKSTLSVVLTRLEAKRLVKRKKLGYKNLVTLDVRSPGGD